MSLEDRVGQVTGNRGQVAREKAKAVGRVVAKAVIGGFIIV